MSGIEIKIKCSDGYELTGTLHRSGQPVDNGIVIICGAIGVSRKFYNKFAKFLTKKKFSAITFDYRGTGDSYFDQNYKNLKLEDWGIQDINALVKYAGVQDFADKVFLVGHSVGGQLFCLSKNCEQLTGVVLIAASFPHWSRWPFPRNLLMFFFWYVLIPILSIGRTKFPTRLLGLSNENLPVQFITRWGEWARDKDYVVSDRFNIDTSRFENLTIPILSFGFDDDTYAPPKALKKLYHSLKKAVIEEKDIRAKKIHPGGIGHFGYFKENCSESIWEETISWLLKF